MLPSQNMKFRLLCLLILVFLAGPRTEDGRLYAQEPAYDLLILGGRVNDGTGNPAFPADVAIREGRIAAVGSLEGHTAKRTIQAVGKLIVPGFIDLHSHADDPLRKERGLRSSDAHRRAAPNLIRQGVTTLVANQDGRSAWPIAEQRALLEEQGTGPNVVLLIGHGTVRGRVMGADFRRPATDAEIQSMKELIRQGMREGARGISAGLEYTPGRWSTMEEVAALVNEIVPWGGVYISHQRSEGSDPMWYWPSQHPRGAPSLLDSVRETIEIGRSTGARVVASHIKAKGAHYWGSGQAAILLIERAREQGVDVWADQYPYDTTGSDGSTVLIPRWVFSGSSGRNARESLEGVLEDSEKAAQLRGDIAHEISRRGGAERIVVFDHPENGFVGKSLAELARSAGVDAVEMAITIQRQGYENRPGGARIRGFSLSEHDIKAYAARPWTATASDAGIALPGDGPVHARFYGTFPRKIRRYAMDLGVITVADAIRSMTSLPALILGLRDRGMVRQGWAADLVVLDLENLRDTATFEEPHQYPTGVEYVIVNGQLLVDNGELHPILAGKVLTLSGDE